MHFVKWELHKLSKVFKSLKRNKAEGFDDLSNNIIIIIDAYDKNQKGTFPDSLKIVKVTPIFKSCDKDIVSNYRPSYISKALRKNFIVNINIYIIEFETII